MSKTVGVLGGMGPAATLDFFSRVLARSGASRDSDHIRLIIDCNPHVPDRNVGAADGAPTTGSVLAQMARGLRAAGAQLLVMPCNAAHASVADIRAATDLPFIDMIEATADAAAEAVAKAGTVGVLAADGALDADLYQGAFAARGIGVLTPEAESQARFMALLYKIKSGDVGAGSRAEMKALADGLIARGAQAIVAGCTEVPLVLDAADLPIPLVNCTEVLAVATVAAARG
jgi:aspartate racemase